MYERVERFISLMWDIIRYAVFQNWNAFNDRMDDLRGWWEGFVDDVYGAINYIVNQVSWWAQREFNTIYNWITWAGNQVTSLWNTLYDKFNEARHYAWEQVIAVYAWVEGQVEWLIWQIGRIDNLILEMYYNWILPALRATKENIDSLWSTVFGNLTAWANWLDVVRDTIEWLWLAARTGLTLFLNDPLGFVLGVYRQMFLRLFGLTGVYGELIHAVIVDILQDVYNFWVLYSTTMWKFFQDPKGFILDQIAEPFVDWAAGLIADAW